MTQSIGRNAISRQDEIGTPLCVTVDFETLDDQEVTVRDRDTMHQDRVSLDNLERLSNGKASLRSSALGVRTSDFGLRESSGGYEHSSSSPTKWRRSAAAKRTVGGGSMGADWLWASVPAKVIFVTLASRIFRTRASTRARVPVKVTTTALSMSVAVSVRMTRSCVDVGIAVEVMVDGGDA